MPEEKKVECCDECGKQITCDEPSRPGLCEECYARIWDEYLKK